MVSYMYVSKGNPYIVAKTQFLTHRDDVGRRRGIMLFPLRSDKKFKQVPYQCYNFTRIACIVHCGIVSWTWVLNPSCRFQMLEVVNVFRASLSFWSRCLLMAYTHISYR